MVQAVIDFLSVYISPKLMVFIISMLPILELRGGLIAASILNIPWFEAAVISIIGNCLPIPVILLFVKKVLGWLKNTKLFHRLAHKYEAKALKKGGELLQKYPGRIMFALYVFVAIPLPMTGAWTGALIAAFLDFPLKRSFAAIAAGVMTAAVIMLTLAYLMPALFGLKG